jgi:hypothetical protein
MEQPSGSNNRRTGNLWTEEEEIQLMRELRQGISISVIATNHQRTSKAIDMRMEMMYKNMKKDGISQEEILQIFGNKWMEYDKRISVTMETIHSDIALLQQKVDNIQHFIEKLYKRIKSKHQN